MWSRPCPSLHIHYKCGSKCPKKRIIPESNSYWVAQLATVQVSSPHTNFWEGRVTPWLLSSCLCKCLQISPNSLGGQFERGARQCELSERGLFDPNFLYFREVWRKCSSAGAPVLEMAMCVGASSPSSVLRALGRVYFPR